MKSANSSLFDPHLAADAETFRDKFMNISPSGPHYTDFTTKLNKSYGKLAAQLGFKAVEFNIVQSNDDLLAESESASSVVRDTQNLRNIRFYIDGQHYEFLRFYKKYIVHQHSERGVLKILNMTKLKILGLDLQKQDILVLYSACMAYFTIWIRYRIGKGSCFDTSRKVAADMSRFVLLGPYEEFSEAIEAHDYDFELIAQRGMLKNALFRTYLAAHELLTNEGVFELLPCQGSVSFGRTKKLTIEELPTNETFFVRDTVDDRLTIVRPLGQNRFSRLHYSYVQTTICEATEKLYLDNVL